MNFRELHKVDCITLNIRGAGDYFFPRPNYVDKKIDSLMVWDGNPDMKNSDLFVTIYSIEQKPLYINVPAKEFSFDNINNRIGEVIDFDLLKITYTGSGNLTLLCHFSMDEKIVSAPEFQRKALDAKNIKLDITERVVELMPTPVSKEFFNLFTGNNADFFQEKNIRMISFDKAQIILLNLVTRNGYLKKIPFWWMSQTPVYPYWNQMPFLMNDEIYLDRSSIEFIKPIGNNTILNLTFYYELNK